MVPGIGLLPQVTRIETEKVTQQSNFAFIAGATNEEPSTYPNKGYEIHMGQTTLLPETKAKPVARLEDGREDGYYLSDSCWGSYLHGILDNPQVLDRLADETDKEVTAFDYEAFKEEQYNKLADWVRSHADVDYIYRTAGVK